MGAPPQPSKLRLPYANEAKAIIAAQLEKDCDAEVSAHFMSKWKIKLSADGSYEVIRDFFANAGVQLDVSVKNALESIYPNRFVNAGDKSSILINLPQIEAPTGQNLVDVRGNKCCFRGACPTCPNFNF